MTLFSHFALAYGGSLALMGVIASWLFRSADAPLWSKIMISTLTVALGCYTPYAVAEIMGYPVRASFESLPDKAELVGFVAHDDGGLVDLWLRSGDVPRAYEMKLDAKMKQALREAREAMAHGERAMMAKAAARDKKKGGGGPSGIGDDKAWILDPASMSGLPSKD